MNKERLDDIVDVLGEQFAKTENTFVIRNQQELVKFINEPEKWKAQQMANMRKYKGILIANARKSIKEINAFTEKVYLLAYQEINKEQIEITKTEIKGEIPKSYADKIKNAKAENIKQILMLSNAAFQTHKQTVQIIDALSTPDNLYNTIKQYSQKGIENGLKINTAGQTGKVRQWSFKAYMEMKVRTTVHNEMVGEQIQAGADVDQVFLYLRFVRRFSTRPRTLSRKNLLQRRNQDTKRNRENNRRTQNPFDARGQWGRYQTNNTMELPSQLPRHINARRNRNDGRRNRQEREFKQRQV